MNETPSPQSPLVVCSYHQEIIGKTAAGPTKSESNWTKLSCPLDEFIQIVTKKGHAFSSQFDHDRRSKKHFCRSNIFAVDFDGELKLEEALSNHDIVSKAAMLYTTPSHSKNGKDRFRVVYLSQEPITNREEYETIVCGLLKQHPLADPSCKDAARFFFGTENASVVKPFGNVLVEEDLSKLKELSIPPEPPISDCDKGKQLSVINDNFLKSSVSVDECRNILAFCDDHYSDYNDWLNVCLGILDEHPNKQGIALLQDRWPNDHIVGEFENMLKHHHDRNPSEPHITVATTIHYAKKNGYPPKSSSNTTSEKTLLVQLQDAFLKSTERGKFIFLEDENGTRHICSLTGHRAVNTLEIEPLTNRETQLVPRLLTALRSIDPNKYDVESAKQLAKQLLALEDLYEHHTIAYVAEPRKQRTYTYKLIPTVDAKDCRNALSHWGEFLDRLSDPEAFAAWIWSVYEPQYAGRQLLYLQGEQGEDGKSVVMQTLVKQFGAKYAYSITQGNTLSSKNSFGASACFGKRIICLPDLQNNALLKYPLVKQITGGDLISIEHKFQQPFSARINGRIFATSNYSLSVENVDFETSRLLWIVVHPPKHKDPNWGDRLSDEYSHFLQYAKWCYSQRCHNHYKIVSCNSETVIAQQIDGDDDHLRVVLETYFEFGDPNVDDWFIKRCEFVDGVKRAGLGKSSYEIQKLKKLVAKWGYPDFNKEQGYQRSDGKGYRGVRLKIW